MVILRQMLTGEFPAYCEYFIEDYSGEIIENYGHPKDVAIDMAKKDLEGSFPHGPESSDHSLLCLEADLDGKRELVGYLWHKVSDDSTFIYDFYISPDYRGKGFGKEALAALEEVLASRGIGQIKLRVAYNNKRALKLYQDVGFEITGLNLAKNIGIK
jgi:ribosomal protein S18 acetylase RimI-like enzyme